jgi:ABC-type multidrug transport system fused ATPase/permease subunit
MLVGTVPIEIVLAVVFLYDLLGWSSLVGVALMLATMFVPIVLAKFLANIQRRLREATDHRIGLMVETMNSVRIVKFFGMEKPFLNRIAEKRDAELKLSLTSAMYNLVYHTISTLLPIFNMLATFGIYTKVMKQPLTASVAFTAISLFDILRSQFTWMAFVSQQVLYAFVSLDRIDKFLNGEEELEQNAHDSLEGEYHPPAFKNATLSWYVPGSEGDNNFRLSEFDVECVACGLTVISGPVGCGKTSFLLGLLGEMRLLDGDIHLPRKHGIAFAAQTPWLQCDTVRNNILFGTEYSEERYQKVVEACALAVDFESFEAGDETEIGERGVSLSGGQKARLALARAVYSPAQTIMLDDVLSALDAGTAKTIVEKCLRGDILAGRTVVLVTHHLSLVASVAKKVIVLADGRIVSDCVPQALSTDVIGMIKEDPQEIQGESQESAAGIIDAPPKANDSYTQASGSLNGKTNGKGTGKLVTEESYGTGRIQKRLIWEYLRNYGGVVILVVLMMLNVADQLGGLVSQYYVALWSDEYTKHLGSVNVDFWLGLYAAVLVGTTLLDVGTYGAWFYFQWLAAKRLHAKLVESVLYSPIRFFDTTPIGRVINRLSNDMRSIDSKIGPYLLKCIMQALEIGMRVVVMSGLIPAFLVPTVTVSILGIACGMMYAKAQVGVKRIVSVKESPLMSHFGDAINGIVTIRAFSCQDRFMNENIKRIDDFSTPYVPCMDFQ